MISDVPLDTSDAALDISTSFIFGTAFVELSAILSGAFCSTYSVVSDALGCSEQPAHLFSVISDVSVNTSGILCAACFLVSSRLFAWTSFVLIVS